MQERAARGERECVLLAAGMEGADRVFLILYVARKAKQTPTNADASNRPPESQAGKKAKNVRLFSLSDPHDGKEFSGEEPRRRERPGDDKKPQLPQEAMRRRR